MECNKLGKEFLKVRAKVTGFLIAKIEKRNTSEQVIVTIKNKKNTITGLQYLLNAFQTYLSGVAYTGATASSPGIVVTTSSGQTYTLPFVNTPGVSTTSDSAIVSFTVKDNSANSYTATSEELVTTSGGYNIPIATASLSVTKNSDEILTMTWIITVTISTSSGIIYIPTPTPQPGGATCTTGAGNCTACAESSVNSQLSVENTGCSPTGLSSQYQGTSFVTSTLFTDIFYNTYGKGPSNSFTYASNTALVIYTQYCMEYFTVGLASGYVNFDSYYNGTSCFTYTSPHDTTYLQVYTPSQTSTYVGVQIEFTT
jgi:hypothetical protein